MSFVRHIPNQIMRLAPLVTVYIVVAVTHNILEIVRCVLLWTLATLHFSNSVERVLVQLNMLVFQLDHLFHTLKLGQVILSRTS